MNRILSILTITFLSVPVTVAATHTAANAGNRKGPTFGIGLGGGTISCADDGCKDFDGAGSLDLHVGGMLNPNLALVFDLWWMAHAKDRLTVEQGIMTAALRVWPVNHFWLQGGLGIARSGVHYKGTFVNASNRTEWVPGFHIGVGVEPIATDSFGLDISLRYGTGFYSDGDDRIHNASLNVGVSFY